MRTIFSDLLMLAMVWTLASGTVWANEKPATTGNAAESYFIFKKSKKEPGLPAYLNHEDSAGGFAKVLAFMDEPRLSALAKNPDVVIYRFTIFPARGHYFCVRVQQEGSRFGLWATHVVPGIPITLAEHKESVLSETDSERLRGLVQRLDFFKMRSQEKPMYLDGEAWLIEGVAGGKYNVIEHDCVSVDSEKRGLLPLYEFCKFLIVNDGLKEIPMNMGYKLFSR